MPRVGRFGTGRQKLTRGELFPGAKKNRTAHALETGRPDVVYWLDNFENKRQKLTQRFSRVKVL